MQHLHVRVGNPLLISFGRPLNQPVSNFLTLERYPAPTKSKGHRARKARQAQEMPIEMNKLEF